MRALSGRGVWDQRATLWASWVVQQDLPNGKANVYFAGQVFLIAGNCYHDNHMSSDTGYMTESGPCPAFKEIGTKYGPFDLAMLPIWRGGSLSFLSAVGLRVCRHIFCIRMYVADRLF
jgi:N-acyl-phosphatidylethanolamine-hydrolysing phospholipase D